MSIIEQAARRLEELRRAGITGRNRPGGADAEPSPVEALPSAEDAPAFATRFLAAGLGHAESAGARDWFAGARILELNLAQIAAKGFLTPDAPRTRLSDEFRAAKHGLLQNIRGTSASPVLRANCIMITSALPGEGKTFTAINLALSLAREIDLSVLLADADVVRPTMAERLSLPPAKGLLDLLSEPGMAPADVVLRTNVDKLHVLGSGNAREQATELLASEGMSRLIDGLASGGPGRIVLLDSPPLLAVPEARALARMAGQIVLVVESERTPRHAVMDALETVADCPIVMLLLNKVKSSAVGSYGYGGGVYSDSQKAG